MKIAIMTDSHENWDNLKRAIKISNDHHCNYLLFAGDLISPQGIDILSTFKGDVKIVWGNNENEKIGIIEKSNLYSNVGVFGEIYEETIDNTRIFMNHYPKVSYLAAKSNDYDLCIYGHTHKLSNEFIDNCLLVNPGEIQGHKSNSATFMIYDTQKKNVEVIDI